MKRAAAADLEVVHAAVVERTVRAAGERRRVLHAGRQLREREGLRPSSGRSATCSRLITWPRLALAVSRSGASDAHGHFFGHRADLHREIEAQAIADADLDAFPLGGREPAQRHGQRVSPDRHERQDVGAFDVGHRLQLRVRVLVAQRHADAGQRRVLRIGDRARRCCRRFPAPPRARTPPEQEHEQKISVRARLRRRQRPRIAVLRNASSPPHSRATARIRETGAGTHRPATAPRLRLEPTRERSGRRPTRRGANWTNGAESTVGGATPGSVLLRIGRGRAEWDAGPRRLARSGARGAGGASARTAAGSPGSSPARCRS